MEDEAVVQEEALAAAEDSALLVEDEVAHPVEDEGADLADRPVVDRPVDLAALAEEDLREVEAQDTAV